MKRDLSKMTCIEDLRRVAKRKMPRMFYDYIDSGSWTETTYRENTSDFKDIRFRQKVLVNMEGRSLETKMIGQDVKMPVAIAPTGFTGMAHADGEILAARAAEKFGIPFTLSTMSICSIEDVAENTSAPFWFQLYVMRDREFMENLIKRAKDAKCSALVLTADLQVLGQRHKDIKNGLSAPPKPTIANLINLATKPEWCMKMLNTERRTFRNIVGHAKNVGDLSSLSSWTSEQFDPRLSWDDVARIKDLWGGKLINQRHYGTRRRGKSSEKRRGRIDCFQPRRPTARRYRVCHQSLARHRQRSGQRHRSLDGQRHPQRSGYFEGVGFGRERYNDRSGVPVWLGRVWRRRRNPCAGNSI
ncbi:L-lactate dehydrogenase [Neisseria meningitidis]|nr:L-lactate dehydrogenase [Neisseria meningitidis]